MKKVPDREEQEAKPRRRGRPTSGVPPVSNAERQRTHRLRLKEEGKQVLHLAVLPELVRELDSLRTDGATREQVIDRLVKSAVQRRKRRTTPP